MMNPRENMCADWIRTDREAVKRDIERLGLRKAINYNVKLMREAKPPWCDAGADYRSMRTAVLELLGR